MSMCKNRKKTYKDCVVEDICLNYKKPCCLKCGLHEKNSKKYDKDEEELEEDTQLSVDD